VLEIEGLVKSYGELEVLRGVDLRVRSGEVVALLGSNGAGKSTLVSIVAGLRSADSGRLLVDGLDASANRAAVSRRLGLAPQDLGIYPTLTVARNLRLFGELAGLRGRRLTRRVDATAQALSLTTLLDRPAGHLSGGQKRRLHTAMALVHEPDLVFLDEPTVGADVRTRSEIVAAVAALAERGAAVVYATHYLAEVEDLGARVAVLEGGRIVADAPVAELVAEHGRTEAVLSFDNRPPLRLADPDPGAAVARTLASLGPESRHLRDVEIVRPGLDHAFLALTGRSISTKDDSTEGVEDVA